MRCILAAARDDSPDLGIAVWLAAITGARRGELCGLRWSDLEDESFVIRRSVVSLSGRVAVKDPKTHRARRVALDDETLRLLRAHRVARAEIALALGLRLEDDAYVLSDHPSAAEPLRPDTFTDRFRRLARRLGLACRLHDLRHWHVTQALGAGLPVRDVAERVGHASARMTLDVYGHAIAGADRRAAEVVAGVLTDAPPRTSARRRPSSTRKSAATSEATLFDTER
jgi:integrase